MSTSQAFETHAVSTRSKAHSKRHVTHTSQHLLVSVGMLENVLGRVLDAFTSAIGRMIPQDSMACRMPTDDQPTVALMARET